MKPGLRSSRRAAAAVLGAAAVVGLAACGTDSANTGSSASLTTTTTAPVTTTDAAAAGDTITDQQKQQLCTDLGEQLQEWRIQGPTLGRGGLNIVVQTWAAQSGVINLQVVQNRSIIDDITIDNCSDVRDEALRSLDIPDLASGLVGF
ncbi:hypothetical protein CH289_20535 [Rhodococcus sp. RS1C4]|uniref:hypothetical protein n=1 Tax=Nocardiaceae TaxID=85025 RepID=UPI00037B954E|nr:MULTISPECIES: hypothetical protein [Rhodococcus]OZC47620.1 hypothetical protein CH289_20535 [Rhodococcus sp. RS1C4]OZC90298.1 hypothetical protein CH282_02905 [Rhodococcus sp. 06-418-1B]OZD13156.1 hypothetical protein CH280_15415 [Rhodococcus sp. 06-156-4C]OZD16248.1 hypothetical protein CH253_22325 [Rhodococcus sp. 06-156-3C]OZD17602.1 hypothetical protein CH248_19160 [Rhodococcus sp. 06-156-4a]